MVVEVRPNAITCASCLAFALMSGCTGDGILLRHAGHLGDADVVGTSADVRVVVSTPLEHDDLVDGQVTYPHQITCAEPSPDIARVVAQSLGGSSALGVKAKSPEAPVEGSLDATGAFSNSYAEAMAQLTERLATIQLLRDGQYRACEAFANGAISDTMYAVLISRYGDTMVTMLLGEMAAGNFGRSLATAGGSAKGKAVGSLKVEKAQEALDSAQASSAEAEKAYQDEKLKQSEATPEEQKQLEPLVEKRDEARKRARQEERDAEQNLSRALHAQAESKAEADATPAGTIARHESDAVIAVAEQLTQMQSNYLHARGVNELVVACLMSFPGRHEKSEESDTTDVAANQAGRPRSTTLSEACEHVARSASSWGLTASVVQEILKSQFIPAPAQPQPAPSMRNGVAKSQPE